MSLAKCAQNARVIGLSDPRVGVFQWTFFQRRASHYRSDIREICCEPLPSFWSGNLVKIAHLDRPHFVCARKFSFHFASSAIYTCNTIKARHTSRSSGSFETRPRQMNSAFLSVRQLNFMLN